MKKVNKNLLAENIKKAILESMEEVQEEPVQSGQPGQDEKSTNMQSDVKKLIPLLGRIDTIAEFNQFMELFLKVAQEQKQSGAVKSALTKLYKALPGVIRDL